MPRLYTLENSKKSRNGSIFNNEVKYGAIFRDFWRFDDQFCC